MHHVPDNLILQSDYIHDKPLVRGALGSSQRGFFAYSELGRYAGNTEGCIQYRQKGSSIGSNSPCTCTRQFDTTVKVSHSEIDT